MKVWSWAPRNWEGLPWWLNPWGEVRLRTEAMDSLAAQVARLTGIEAGLMAERARLANECERLRSKLRAALAPQGNLHSATAAQVPEFVLVGIDRGNGRGKRLIAGRDLPGAELVMTGIDDPPPRWVINAKLARPLFIDRPDYAAALDHMRQVWMNWDREQPASRAGIEPPPRGMIEP